MDFKAILRRAKRGLREELRLYLVAISSLSIAFLCVGGALLVNANLAQLATQWGQSGRMSIYLADDAEADDIAQLRVVLEGLPEVEGVEHLTSEQARLAFLEDADLGAELSALPAEVFPGSIEVDLVARTPTGRQAAIASQVGQFSAVTDVETYRGFFARLGGLIQAGEGLAGLLAILVALCVLAVIGNTIRLAVARRRPEIEVMKLCGATDGFVRGPFVIEGTFQGLAAALIAVLVLVASFVALRGQLDGSLAALTGVRTAFLDPWMLVALIVGGAAVGAIGSAVSVRRYLTI